MLMEAMDNPYVEVQEEFTDNIFDDYAAGRILYEDAEATLEQTISDPDELDVALAILNTTVIGITEDAIEGELITQDRTMTAGIARDIIEGAGASLYKDGMKPTAGSILQRSEKMAGAFYNQLLMAIDNELGKSNE